MASETSEHERVRRIGVALVVSAVMLATAGCSSEQPKPMPQPTPDQVRSHGDRTFDKLKQEEQERGAQPSAPR
ncbi:protein of unknown function [Nitrospira japonica]|uniref:Lipoprotein n=1 Tax=Nitrospira japonica TaxID=1325564 RepID=A0A1W1I606_9BACT|nr:hypothetical protein [Nitrospira japonica]SLM48430.1 protein of unknown function [Nitrospira japonica]